MHLKAEAGVQFTQACYCPGSGEHKGLLSAGKQYQIILGLSGGKGFLAVDPPQVQHLLHKLKSRTQGFCQAGFPAVKAGQPGDCILGLVAGEQGFCDHNGF